MHTNGHANPHAGEFGRHWEDHTGTYVWDGVDDGVDFTVWAYAHNPQREAAGYTVIVQQMMPPPIHVQEAPPMSWGLRFLIDDPLRRNLADLEFTLGVFEETALVDGLAERLPLDWLPEELQARVWEAACEGFIGGDGAEHFYDLASGTWSTTKSK